MIVAILITGWWGFQKGSFGLGHTLAGSVWVEWQYELHTHFPRATVLKCCFIVSGQSWFEKHPNYLLVLWLWKVSLSPCRHSGRTALVTEAPSSASLHGSRRLAGSGPVMGRLQVRQHGLIISQTQQNRLFLWSQLLPCFMERKEKWRSIPEKET